MNARWSGVSRFALPAALAVSLGLVVVLARQKTAQDERYASLQESTILPRPGVFVPTFTASTLDGSSVTIGERPDSGKQVLFAFTTTCPYCLASLPAIREIAAAAVEMQKPSVAMVGIALDTLELARAYAASNALSFPIVEFPARKLRYLYRARSVPIILVLDAEGRIVLGRVGVLTDRAAVDSVLAAMRWKRDQAAVVATQESGPE